jgi:hypothetical protein
MPLAYDAVRSPVAANNGPSWTGVFLKSLLKGPSTGPGSCLGVFTDTVTAPLKQIQTAVKNYVPLIVGAMQAGPSGAAMYMQQLNNMVASGAADDLLPNFRTKLSMISAKERGSGYVEEQSHGSADDRSAQTTGSGS